MRSLAEHAGGKNAAKNIYTTRESKVLIQTTGHHVPEQEPSQLFWLRWHHPSLVQPPPHPPQQQGPFHQPGGVGGTGEGEGAGALVGVGEPSANCQQICPYAALRYPKYLTTVCSSMSSK